MKLTSSTHRGGAGPERRASRPPPQPVLSSTTFTRAQIFFLGRQHFQQMRGEGQENSSFVSISISNTWHCHFFSVGRSLDLYIFEVSGCSVAAGFYPAEMGGFPQVSRSNMSTSSPISPPLLRLPTPIRP